MSTQAPGRRKFYCAEVRSVAAAPPRFLGLSLSYPPSSSRRKPGPRDHRALGGNQKDIEPLQPPRHRGCCLFKKARAPCRRKACCDEVRPVAAAPPWLLGPCFRRGNERSESLYIVPAKGSLR